MIPEIEHYSIEEILRGYVAHTPFPRIKLNNQQFNNT